MSELRYAFRMLAKSKGFAAVAILSLALAIGLTTTTYAILDSFVNPYVPYREPEQLIRTGVDGDPGYRALTSLQRYEITRDRVNFAEEWAQIAYSSSQVNVGATVEDLSAYLVSANYFTMLDVTPQRGRTLSANGDEDAVIVSHQVWTRLLGRRPLDDLTIMIDGASATVIGVMPPDMPPGGDLWRLLTPARTQTSAGRRSIQPVARLKTGVTLQQAQADMVSLGKELTTTYGSGRFFFKGTVAPLVAPRGFLINPFHIALAGSSLVVLLIACANLANLMLARGVARRSEMALRLAIGASRGALVRQVLTEAAILAVVGGLLGTVLSLWGVGITAGSVPRGAPLNWIGTLHVSWRVATFAIVMTGVTVLLFGLFPALRASSVDVAEPIKQGGGTTTGRHRRISLLAVSQVGLALVVLMAATLLTKSARMYASEDWGYDLNGLYTTSVSFRDSLSDAEVEQRIQNIRERTAGVPGVKAVSVRAWHPTDGRVAISDYVRKEKDSLAITVLNSFSEVSHEYMGTRGTGIARGRDFVPGDHGVAIINRGAAERLWPRLDPIGRMIKLGNPTSAQPWLRVIGVTAGGRDFMGDPNLGQLPEVYVPFSTGKGMRRQWSILARVEGSDGQVVVRAGREIQAAAGYTTPVTLSPEGRYYSLEAEWQKIVSRIFLFLGACALGLASVGLYGVLAYTVSRRMREFAVRIALGASNNSIFRLVLRDGTITFLAGTALGAFAALAGASVIDMLLFKTSFGDVWSLVLSEALLCTAAFLACLRPALRAMRSDPVEILRAT